MDKPTRLHDINSASWYLGISSNAIYMALQKKKLDCVRLKGRVFFEERALDVYRMSRYNRDEETLNGKKIFSEDHGLYSIPTVARILQEKTGEDITAHALYYFIKTRHFPAIKIKNRWVINQDTLSKMIDFFKYRNALKQDYA
jgi:hypothetical protein